MDAQELATNALVNHWPAHLGVKTDQEKIEYLAREVERLAGIEAEAEAAREEAENLDLANDALQAAITELRAELKEKS